MLEIQKLSDKISYRENKGISVLLNCFVTKFVYRDLILTERESIIRGRERAS